MSQTSGLLNKSLLDLQDIASERGSDIRTPLVPRSNPSSKHQNQPNQEKNVTKHAEEAPGYIEAVGFATKATHVKAKRTRSTPAVAPGNAR